MALNERFEHSRVLFIDEDGKPLRFLMCPSKEKERLKPLIEFGGGEVTSRSTGRSHYDYIKLGSPGAKVYADDQYQSRYIDHCIQQNKLLDRNKFKMIEEEEVSFNLEEWEPASNMVNITVKDKKGRRKYTYSEERRILDYILAEQDHSKRGDVLWKKMEMVLEGNGHSWQSMKDHYWKQMLPRIQSYNLKPVDLAYLTDSTVPLVSQEAVASARRSPVASARRSPVASARRSPVASDRRSPVASDRRSPVASARRSPVASRPAADGDPDRDWDDFDRALLLKADKAEHFEQPPSQHSTPKTAKGTGLQQLCKGPSGDTVGRLTRAPSTSTDPPLEELRTSPRRSPVKNPVKEVERNSKTSPVASKLLREADGRFQSRKRSRKSREERESSSTPRRKSRSLNDSTGDSGSSQTESQSTLEMQQSNSAQPDSTQRSPAASMSDIFAGGDLCSGGESSQSPSMPEARKHASKVAAYIMESQSQAIESATESESIDETEQGDNLELQRKLQLANDVRDWLELTEEEFLSVLYSCNGSLTDTINYVLDLKPGIVAWSSSEDEVLLHGNREEYKTLVTKYGKPAVVKRQSFLAENLHD